MTATINQLANELVTLVKSQADFVDSSFYVFDTDDFEQRAGFSTFPAAGIMYEGSAPQEGNRVDGQIKLASAVLLQVFFSVSIAVSYQYGSGDDTKAKATALLDAVRPVILGYKGVNTRPWVFIKENPIETELEGVIAYAQLWSTTIPVISK